MGARIHRLVIVAGLLNLFACVASAQPTTLPDVIVILADDMGFPDLGCYGTEIRTPSIDKLVTEGGQSAAASSRGLSAESSYSTGELRRLGEQLPFL